MVDTPDKPVRSDKISLAVDTPDRRVLSESVDEVVMPSVDGYFGVLPGHAPLLAALDAGEISFRIGTEQHYLAVSGGFVEVLRDSVSVLAETSEKAEEIDVDRAERAKQRAETVLKDGQAAPDQFSRAEVKLKRALSRLRVSGRLR